jgi:hypothetical protein
LVLFADSIDLFSKASCGPDGMHCLFSANHALRKDFKRFTTGITEKVLAASV